MFDNLVRYLTATDALPEAQLLGFDYLLAGNGLFKRARNRHMEALIPLAEARVAGLAPVQPYLRLAEGLVSGRILQRTLQDAREMATPVRAEAMYHLLRRRGDGRTAIQRPRQVRNAVSLQYDDAGDPSVVADVHSHHDMAARFSATDDGDETGFRIYVVLGRIFQQPEIAVRLGVYGDHYAIPAGWVFDSIEPFTDTHRARRRCEPTCWSLDPDQLEPDQVQPECDQNWSRCALDQPESDSDPARERNEREGATRWIR